MRFIVSYRTFNRDQRVKSLAHEERSKGDSSQPSGNQVSQNARALHLSNSESNTAQHFHPNPKIERQTDNANTDRQSNSDRAIRQTKPGHNDLHQHGPKRANGKQRNNGPLEMHASMCWPTNDTHLL